MKRFVEDDHFADVAGDLRKCWRQSGEIDEQEALLLGLAPTVHRDAHRQFQRAQAFVVLGEPVLFSYRGQISVVAIRNRLPAISTAREYAVAGLLLTYGIDLRDLFRRSAVFVDKIFKGAKPADLPVEQPTKFEELVVNLKTAKALSLEIPPTFLSRADEVIE